MSRVHVRILTLALCALAWSALAPAPASAQQQSFRGDKWQFNIPLNFTFSKSIDGEGGSSVDLNNDFGWGLGFGYNFNRKFMLGFTATWLSAHYDATVPYDEDGDGNEDGVARVGGTLDATSLQAIGQYNFLENTFTPFLRGNLGFSYTDSNIPSAPPQGSCWWDPWWGYVCGTWQPTYDRTSFSFGGSAGLRMEVSRSFFLEGSFNLLWVSYPESTPSFSAIQLNVGWLF
jgi:hypothetical protein